MFNCIDLKSHTSPSKTFFEKLIGYLHKGRVSCFDLAFSRKATSNIYPSELNFLARIIDIKRLGTSVLVPPHTFIPLENLYNV